MYDTAKLIFARVPSITDVEIKMPNIHYFVADLSKLKIPNSGEVRITVYTNYLYDILSTLFPVASISFRQSTRYDQCSFFTVNQSQTITLLTQGVVNYM